jgi:hypothetical protein
MAQLRRRSRRVGNERVRVSPHECAAARRQRRPLLPARASPADARPAGGAGVGCRTRRRRRCTVLRRASAARRISGVDHRAARCAVGAVLLAHRARLPASMRRGRGDAPPLVPRLHRGLRARLTVQVAHHVAAAGSPGPRRLPVAPGARQLAPRAAREGPVSRPRARRRRGVGPGRHGQGWAHVGCGVSAVGTVSDGALQPRVLRRQDARAARALADVRAAGEGCADEPAVPGGGADRRGADRRARPRAPALARGVGRLARLRAHARSGERHRAQRAAARRRSLQLSLVPRPGTVAGCRGHLRRCQARRSRGPCAPPSSWVRSVGSSGSRL